MGKGSRLKRINLRSFYTELKPTLPASKADNIVVGELGHFFLECVHLAALEGWRIYAVVLQEHHCLSEQRRGNTFTKPPPSTVTKRPSFQAFIGRVEPPADAIAVRSATNSSRPLSAHHERQL
jgi:hypothetical protein